MNWDFKVDIILRKNTNWNISIYEIMEQDGATYHIAKETNKLL